MAKVINLRTRRKQAARAAARDAGTANAASHGISLSSRKRARAEEALTQRRLDGHRRDTPPENTDPED